MKSTKNIPLKKSQVIVNKDTFDTMEKIVKESKKVIELQPKINEVFQEINSYANSIKHLKKKIRVYKKIKSLKTRNHNLLEENKNLKSYIKVILELIKHFFRKLLQIGNEPTKEATTIEIKDYFDNQDFDSKGVYDISKGTTNEEELFDYASIPSYLKTSKKSHEKDKDDFEINL